MSIAVSITDIPLTPNTLNSTPAPSSTPSTPVINNTGSQNQTIDNKPLKNVGVKEKFPLQEITFNNPEEKTYVTRKPRKKYRVKKQSTQNNDQSNVNKKISDIDSTTGPPPLIKNHDVPKIINGSDINESQTSKRISVKRKSKQLEDDYNEKESNEVKKSIRKGKKDKNLPKKPMNAYLQFALLKRPEFAEKNPEISLSQVNILLGKTWNTMSKEEKKPYFQLAKEAKIKYKEEMEAYDSVKQKEKVNNEEQDAPYDNDPLFHYPKQKEKVNSEEQDAPYDIDPLFHYSKQKEKVNSEEQDVPYDIDSLFYYPRQKEKVNSGEQNAPYDIDPFFHYPDFKSMLNSPISFGPFESFSQETLDNDFYDQIVDTNQHVPNSTVWVKCEPTSSTLLDVNTHTQSCFSNNSVHTYVDKSQQIPNNGQYHSTPIFRQPHRQVSTAQLQPQLQYVPPIKSEFDFVQTEQDNYNLKVPSLTMPQQIPGQHMQQRIPQFNVTHQVFQQTPQMSNSRLSNSMSQNMKIQPIFRNNNCQQLSQKITTQQSQQQIMSQQPQQQIMSQQPQQIMSQQPQLQIMSQQPQQQIISQQPQQQIISQQPQQQIISQQPQKINAQQSQQITTQQPNFTQGQEISTQEMPQQQVYLQTQNASNQQTSQIPQQPIRYSVQQQGSTNQNIMIAPPPQTPNTLHTKIPQQMNNGVMQQQSFNQQQQMQRQLCSNTQQISYQTTWQPMSVYSQDISQNMIQRHWQTTPNQMNNQISSYGPTQQITWQQQPNVVMYYSWNNQQQQQQMSVNTNPLPKKHLNTQKNSDNPLITSNLLNPGTTSNLINPDTTSNLINSPTSNILGQSSNSNSKLNNPVPSSSNGVSKLNDSEVPDLLRYVTYSAATYCDKSSDWTCGKYCDNIPQTTVAKPIITKPAQWVEILGQDAKAYCLITTNSKFKEIVVTFRGTADLGNTFKDYEVNQWPYGFDSTSLPVKSLLQTILVHYGFYSTFLTFQIPIRNEISKLTKQYPDYKVVVTGHSLGGALAVFAALDIKQYFEECNPYLYTYGEPRVGNSDFASFVNKELPFVRRVICQDDIVPHLIPRVDYEHHKGEVWIYNSTTDQAVKCSGDENQYCSDSVDSNDRTSDDHDGPYWGLLISDNSCS
ncbi:296_t:CDS:10 [Scutellospora calospora]|uniref:296_t:CDS:1 n=1 Tax=Scutellospora calospora TaxID=85575 RepID=A0ACA9JVR5_9GLOM|nr:296_t:CDS:10 [Scutellospora calospora]